jgi:hypothetical protein
MRLEDGQTFFNGNQPLMKKCSNFWELLSGWGWYKCQNWATTGAAVDLYGSSNSRNEFIGWSPGMLSNRSSWQLLQQYFSCGTFVGTWYVSYWDIEK